MEEPQEELPDTVEKTIEVIRPRAERIMNDAAKNIKEPHPLQDFTDSIWNQSARAARSTSP